MNWDLVWDHKDFNLPATAFILGRPRLVRYGHLHFLLLGHRLVGSYYHIGIIQAKVELLYQEPN